MITTATILSGVAQGLIWAILTLGVYLTFRILDIADLTVEGTFPLGAAVTVVLINTGMSPAMAMLCALLAGAAAGFITGFLHTIFQIPAILSVIFFGIVTCGDHNAAIQSELSYRERYDRNRCRLREEIAADPAPRELPRDTVRIFP